MSNYNSQNQTEKGNLPNVPARHYGEFERIAIVRQPGRPASTRAAIPYINVPGPDQTWAELNQWRAAYGLNPVTQ